MIIGLNTARKDVIKKSFAFYNALRLAGCGFSLQEPTVFKDDEKEVQASLVSERKKRIRGHVEAPKCEGRLCFVLDSHSQPYIR